MATYSIPNPFERDDRRNASAASPFSPVTAPAFTSGINRGDYHSAAVMNNALNANKLADFAAAAPMPTDPIARQGRTAYINEHRNRADLLSGNYFANKGFAGDANNRANDYVGGMTNLFGAQAGDFRSQSNRRDYLSPFEANQMQAQTGVANAQIPGIQADNTRKGMENDLFKQEMPNMAELFSLQPQLGRQQVQMGNLALQERQAGLPYVGPAAAASVQNMQTGPAIEFYKQQVQQKQKQIDTLLSMLKSKGALPNDFDFTGTTGNQPQNGPTNYK